ncbi:MAG TPA: FtsX-like permease family protein [Candidatus Pelagibacter bacterium]|nr:lipoprotein-releasing system transmembrane subunit LolC [Pelagibacteraceae bacterium]HJN84470.1 FtsX-like permease family protein [Candidatus Pelagibacter bacterium]
MISALEKKITFRYLKPKKKDGFLNIISIFSFIGISIGVAVLIIVMSVMNGFRTELVNKILGFNAHVIVEPLNDTIDISKLSKNNLNNLSTDLIFTNSAEGVLISKNTTKGLVLRGYSTEDFLKLEFIKKENFIGNPSELSGNSISIGRNLSLDYDLKVGDKIALMSTSGIQTIVGTLPKQENYLITSIYDSGLTDFDRNIAFLNIENLEKLFDLDSSKRNLEIYLINPLNIDSAKIKIQNIFNDAYTYSWADMNSSLFSALKVERNVMFIILSLIIIVAAFNIISGLTILVKNKTRDIAILKSIGVQNSSITKIFFMVGFFIGTTATLFGIFLGVLFSIYIEKIRFFLSSVFNISLFPEEIYFLSKMPSEINIDSILIIAICSILITIIVSIYPAKNASKQDLIKSLKYE